MRSGSVETAPDPKEVQFKKVSRTVPRRKKADLFTLTLLPW
jgi:hypothetical protein